MVPGTASYPGGTAVICTSVPQILTASTSTNTWSSLWILGTGTIFSSSLPTSSKTAANIFSICIPPKMVTVHSAAAAGQ